MYNKKYEKKKIQLNYVQELFSVYCSTYTNVRANPRNSSKYYKKIYMVFW
jgi:hypothetical protein